MANRISWRRIRWPAAIAASLLAATLAVAGLVNAVGPDLTSLHPIRAVAGTVTIVNQEGDAFCLDPDGGGDQFCSVAYQPLGSAALVVGQHASGTVLLRPIRAGAAEEIFIASAPAVAP